MDIYFENNATTAYAWEEAITIDKSGMYYLWFVTCDDDLSAVTVAGATEWKNPTGYLPGAMIPLVSLHAVAAAAYGVLLIGWGVAAVRHAADVGFLQRAVGGVIALGAAEAITWACDFAHFNATGHRPPASTLYAVLVGCGRRTLARYVALVVSLGAGVVVPVLSPLLRHKVAALCVTYVLASGAASGLASVGQVDDLTGGARALLGLPVAALDAVFVLWIFSSLSRTLAQVAARRAASKLDLYRKFTNLLAVMVWASVAWIAYETYYKVSERREREREGERGEKERDGRREGGANKERAAASPPQTPLVSSHPSSPLSLSLLPLAPQVTDPYNERWRFDWITGAFWVALDFAFTAAVAVMFRPSAAATRFAYSDADAAAAAGDAEYEALEKGAAAAAAAAGRASEAGSAKIPAGKAGGGVGAGGDASDEEAAKME